MLIFLLRPVLNHLRKNTDLLVITKNLFQAVEQSLSVDRQRFRLVFVLKMSNKAIQWVNLEISALRFSQINIRRSE